MLLLARHGRTAHNAQGRFQGRDAVPLDADGRSQAVELAERVAGREDVTRLVSSPLTRALQTAAAVGVRLGLVPEVEPRLAETHTGAWTQRTYAEVRAEDPEGYAAFRRLDLDFAAPEGEAFLEQLARCRAAVDDLRATGAPDRPDGRPGATLAVCHGNVIRLLLRDRDGVAPTHAELDNAALLEL